MKNWRWRERHHEYPLGCYSESCWWKESNEGKTCCMWIWTGQWTKSRFSNRKKSHCKLCWLALTSTKKLEAWTIVIKAAFLQGQNIQRTIYWDHQKKLKLVERSGNQRNVFTISMMPQEIGISVCDKRFLVMGMWSHRLIQAFSSGVTTMILLVSFWCMLVILFGQVLKNSSINLN